MREKSRSGGGGWRYLNQTWKKDLRGICLGVGAEGSGQINTTVWKSGHKMRGF